MKPAVSSEANNIQSFQIELTNPIGLTPSTFEIDEISIVYKTKSIK